MCKSLSFRGVCKHFFLLCQSQSHCFPLGLQRPDSSSVTHRTDIDLLSSSVLQLLKMCLLVFGSDDENVIFFPIVTIITKVSKSVKPFLLIHGKISPVTSRWSDSVKPLLGSESALWTWVWLRGSAMGPCVWSARNSGEDRVDIVLRCVTHRGQGSGCSGQRDDRGAACEANTWVPSQSVICNIHHERLSATDWLLIRTHMVYVEEGSTGFNLGFTCGTRCRGAPLLSPVHTARSVLLIWIKHSNRKCF